MYRCYKTFVILANQPFLPLLRIKKDNEQEIIDPFYFALDGS
jgi:hypothetical protein